MGIALIKIKIMHESPKKDLELIKDSAYDLISENDGKNIMFNEEDIAFGLRAVIASFDLDESLPLDPIEDSLKDIERVSSVQVIDMRRAFG